MMRANKIWLCIAAIALIILVASQMLLPGAAIAQQPPPTPDPKPTPTPAPTACATCCEMMAVGGRTIGGPATGTQEPGADDIRSIVFAARARGGIDICVTAENTTTPVDPFTRTTDIFVRLTTGAGADDVGLARIAPGQIETVCGRVGFVLVQCVDGAVRPCTFKWRVDHVN